MFTKCVNGSIFTVDGLPVVVSVSVKNLYTNLIDEGNCDTGYYEVTYKEDNGVCLLRTGGTDTILVPNDLSTYRKDIVLDDYSVDNGTMLSKLGNQKYKITNNGDAVYVISYNDNTITADGSTNITNNFTSKSFQKLGDVTILFNLAGTYTIDVYGVTSEYYVTSRKTYNINVTDTTVDDVTTTNYLEWE